MPALLHNDMTELELLRHTVAAYADESNWKAYEKDYGSDGRSSGLVMRPSWASRDTGFMARQAQELIQRKKIVGNGRIRAVLRMVGCAVLTLAFFYMMIWAFSVGCVLMGHGQDVCGL